MTDEERLIKEACTGRPEAFDALVTPHLPRIYRLAFLITRHAETAADAVQEALLRSYRSLRNLRPGHAFSPWLVRIVVNEAVKQARRGHRWLLALTGSKPDPSSLETPELLAQAREEQIELWGAVQRLSPAHRAVIVLRYYEEMSEAEMAVALDIPPGTVKSRLFHARAALEKLLKRTEQAGPAWSWAKAVRGGDGDD